jgi:hypothetical protein
VNGRMGILGSFRNSASGCNRSLSASSVSFVSFSRRSAASLSRLASANRAWAASRSVSAWSRCQNGRRISGIRRWSCNGIMVCLVFLSDIRVTRDVLDGLRDVSRLCYPMYGQGLESIGRSTLP